MSLYLNTQQNIVILALTTVSSILSITGSLLILRFIKDGTYREAVTAQRGRGPGSAYTPTYLRIMAAMSFFDVFYSTNWILQPIISDSADYDNLLVGNQATCNFTGFMTQLGFASFIYYGFLSFYYLFTVRWGKSQRWMSQRAEPWMHVIAIGFPTITAIAGLIIDCYSYIDLMLACWVANWPKGCIRFSRNDDNCSDIPGYIFGGIPFFFFIPALTINSFLVFRHVRKVYMGGGSSHFTISRRSGNFVSSIDERQKQRIREVGTQTTLYVVAALLTYMPLIINELVLVVILRYGADSQPQFYPWMCVAAVLTSLAGFWNAIIFFRPTYKRLREKNTGRWEAIKMILLNDKASQQRINRAAVAAARAKRRNSFLNSRESNLGPISQERSNDEAFDEDRSTTASSKVVASIKGNKVSDSTGSEEISSEQKDSRMSASEEDGDDSYDDVAAETIPALFRERQAAQCLKGQKAVKTKTQGGSPNSKNSNDKKDDNNNINKILTPGAFENIEKTVKFRGESEYTMPSTHNA